MGGGPFTAQDVAATLESAPVDRAPDADIFDVVRQVGLNEPVIVAGSLAVAAS